MHKDELRRLREKLTFLRDDGVPHAESVFTNTGLHVERKDENVKALDYLNRALKLSPRYVRGLRARAQLQSTLFKRQNAKADLETLLKETPDDVYALSVQAFVTYQSTEFEQAMMQNFKMSKVRRKPDNFVLGMMHCQDAIENAVGPRCGHPLRDHYKIIRKLAWNKSIESQKSFLIRQDIHRRKKKKTRLHVEITKLPGHPERELKSVKSKSLIENPDMSTDILTPGESSGLVLGLDMEKEQEESLKDTINTTKVSSDSIIPKVFDYPFSPLQRYTKNIENYMAERYLDGMYRDKLFLKKIKGIPGLCCPNEAANIKIGSLVKSAQKFIWQNQETLRARRPFYFYKFQEAKLKGAKLKRRQTEQLEIIRDLCQHEAAVLLHKCQKAANEANVHYMIEHAEKLRNYCEGTQKKFLPMREEVLQDLYDTVCDGYLNVKKFKPEMSEADKITRARVFMSCPLQKEPSRDSLFKKKLRKRQDFNKLCPVYEELIRKARYEEEALWLFYELSRMNMHRKDYQLSKIYAKKCCTLAESTGNLKWQVNAMWLTARIFVAQKNQNDARHELKKAKYIVRKLRDPKLTEFLKVCTEVVASEQLEETKAENLILERQNNIIKLLSTYELKTKADVLFRKIRTLPVERRMTVLPGISYVDLPKYMTHNDSSSDNQSQYSAKTIKSTKSAKSRVSTTDFKKGVGFMDLIQYHFND